jgi:hypothetical protein
MVGAGWNISTGPATFEDRHAKLSLCHPPIESYMTRYYFYSADLYYYDPARGGAPARLGDYQGVYEIEEESLTPSQAFTNLLEELRKTVPADLGGNAYYHVTQFNNVT